MKEVEFSSLIFLCLLGLSRNWHHANAAGCQGFIGPVPPPFLISNANMAFFLFKIEANEDFGFR